MPDTPFVGPTYSLRSKPASVQRTVNMEPVPLEPGNERTGWVFKDVVGLVTMATQPSGPADSLYSLVFWLLPGSTNFQDYGPLAKGSASVFGEVVTNTHILASANTIQAGGAAGQRCEVASSPIPDVFCIEGFFYSDLSSGQGAIFSNRNGSALGFVVNAISPGTLQFSVTSGGTVIANPIGLYTAGAWNYFAMNRNAAGDIQLFMGVPGGTATQQGVTLTPGLSKPLDGGTHWSCGVEPSDAGGINIFRGAISNLRVTLASRYTSSFSVPATPFPTR